MEGGEEVFFFLTALCLAASLLQDGVLKTKQSINNSSDMHICMDEEEGVAERKRHSKLMRWVWRAGTEQ